MGRADRAAEVRSRNISLDFISNFSSVREQIRQRHPKQFDFINRVETFCREVRGRLNVYNRDRRQVIAACLMLKIFEDIYGAVILLELGMVSQGRSLLRVATEAVIILAKVVDSEQFFDAYVNSSEVEQLKFLQKIRENKHPAFDEIRKEAMSVIEQLKQNLEGTEPKILEQWARDVKLDFMYQIVFRLFSKDVHTDPRVLERYLVFREDGEVGQLVWGPSSNDMGPELLEAAQIMTLAAGAIGDLFELKIQEDVKRFWDEMAEFVRAH